MRMQAIRKNFMIIIVKQSDTYSCIIPFPYTMLVSMTSEMICPGKMGRANRMNAFSAGYSASYLPAPGNDSQPTVILQCVGVA